MNSRTHVVVITGASSGIGRETAVRFARQGSVVVLAARRRDALEETARMCRGAGATALPLVTDVTYEDQVQRVAERALAQFGQIDVWINNAGVTLFAPIEATPFAEHARVIETNLYGAMYGARAVIPVFRRQGRGVLINVGSLLSKIAQPFVPAYVISKFALRGLSEALRAELADVPGAHVCTIFPYAINTPHFESAANLRGRRPRVMPPEQSPEKVARAIVALAKRPQRERTVPESAALVLMAHFFFPKTVERAIFEGLREWHFDEAAVPRTEGNLFEPAREKAEVRGSTPPRLGAPHLLLWLARQMLRVGVRGAAKRLARLRTAPRLPYPGGAASGPSGTERYGGQTGGPR